MNGSASLAQGVRETASALGMDPTDLATIISYETGGTFNPTQRGPTTQWGQHRGLIQFGEPQARQYGVDWNNPESSQLGADGAIARYFSQNGWKPGMGLLDAYSIVNAGGPGLYNRSDANNGGAPGTVADKVRNQMGGHRQNALRLLGSDPQATVSTKGTATMMQQEEETPRGLLGGLGVQKMQEGAPGETGQRFYNRDSFKDTAALLAQGFGRMGIMGMEEIADGIAKERTEAKAKNRTIEAIRKMGTPQSQAALEYIKAGGDAVGALKIAFDKPAKPSAKEEQIQRLMSTGVPEDVAIGIADGRLVVSRDPATGEATIVDKAQLLSAGQAAQDAPATEQPVQPEGAGADVFAGTNPTGALGFKGLGANILNTVVDAFGGGQPADKIAKASSALGALSTNTSLGLASEFPGRPSNLTREMIEDLTIKPGEFGMGPGKALDKTENMIRTIQRSLGAANRVLGGRFSPTDKAAAKASINMLNPLLGDYQSLLKALTAQSPASPNGVTIRPDVAKRLEKY